uniref:Uncharacterized protein n=1 Tax=Anopheles atroparvus TaxID=41427 RepID=A0A182J5P8_ANOAO
MLDITVGSAGVVVQNLVVASGNGGSGGGGRCGGPMVQGADCTAATAYRRRDGREWVLAVQMRMVVMVQDLLPAVVDALVIVQAVQRAKHLVAEVAHRIVERLQVLLLFVPLEGQLGTQQLTAHVAPVARR